MIVVGQTDRQHNNSHRDCEDALAIPKLRESRGEPGPGSVTRMI